MIAKKEEREESNETSTSVCVYVRIKDSSLSSSVSFSPPLSFPNFQRARLSENGHSEIIFFAKYKRENWKPQDAKLLQWKKVSFDGRTMEMVKTRSS